MASAAALAAAFVEIVTSSASKNVPFIAYAKAAVTCALASPLGYASLKYISFPLMILAKSSKPGYQFHMRYHFLLLNCVFS